ncbi:MAG: protein TolR [Deltaproteobacteria bacterium]|jgi:biopolymer transport protein TolR|nr:protein TolR [Desulfobacterales bacterium]MDL1980953.1 protein TolR [Deltaproteobacteria bacterium]MCD4805729.1 protein TolR [Desulfobacterales bacterium]MDL1984461.1 protein TolR [Deltaproteobacteria bacterium]MDL1987628.1 protein TolR [Deltaproteobacteria bacterium]
MAFGGNNNSFMSDINVTPFVDVMLVLLIIFMVTAPMMIEGVNVSLPEATSEPLPAEQDPLIITIDKNNLLYINDYQVTLDFLQEKLIKILDGRVGQEVYLKADKNISYGVVVRVMSEIKGAGIEKLGMVTEPIKSDKEK